MYHGCKFKWYTLTSTLLLMFSEVRTGDTFSYSKCAKTQKSEIVTTLKNLNRDKPKTSNCDQTKKKCIVTNLKKHKNSITQTLTKSKISNCDKTEKHKLQQNSVTQITTKLK